MDRGQHRRAAHRAVREQIGDGRAICALSGGVDSVAAALVQRAIGDRLTCVFVDHGLLRAGEREQVETDFAAAIGARSSRSTIPTYSSAPGRGHGSETKRKIIGRVHPVLRAGRRPGAGAPG